MSLRVLKREELFDGWSHSQIHRSLTISIHVHRLKALVKQIANNFSLVHSCGQMKQRIAFIVFLKQVTSFESYQSYNIRQPESDSHHQWCLATECPLEYVSTLFDETLGQLAFPSHDSPIKDSIAFFILCFQVSAILHEVIEYVISLLFKCDHHGSESIVCLDIDSLLNLPAHILLGHLLVSLNEYGLECHNMI
jgi:hypothetical protein